MAITGSISFCLLNGLPWSFTARLKWMAIWGITINGRLKFTNWVAGFNGFKLRNITRPAMDNGLSNHVYIIGPPYTSVFNFKYFPATGIAAFGLILNVGESLWAQTILNPSSAISPLPISKAKSEEWFFVTKYLPPLSICHASPEKSCL